MSRDISIHFNPDEDLPCFSLQRSDGEKDAVKVPMMEVIEASATTDMSPNASRDQLQLHVFNKYKVRLPDYVASIMQEEAFNTYESLKKNCMRRASSEDSGSNPEKSQPLNEKSSSKTSDGS